MNTQLQQYTDEGLKALAYDFLILIEQNQNNLKIVNQELQARTSRNTGTAGNTAPSVDTPCEDLDDKTETATKLKK